MLWFPMFGALVALSLYSCASDRSSSHPLHAQITQCENCHSLATNIPSTAPSLDGMTEDYLEEQLANFKHAKRGIDPTDAMTLSMSQQAKTLSDEQISLIADYYSRRTRQLSKESVSGNAKNGERLYKEQCEGCHSSMLGRYFTNSPRITHLRGSYLLAQLNQFSKSQRVVVEDSKHKIKMAAVAKNLSESDQSNIVAFIKEHYTD
ncbi:MAG: c-type cytochrome [Nitrospirota bacterium]|nr:c-type cytochrome [Nitrospirota bacterium]